MGYSCGCPLIRAGFLSVYLIALGCSSPIVKPGAIDPAILKRKPLPGNLISQVKGGEYTVQRNSGWMGDIDHPKHLFFAGFRPGSKSLLFCLVIACDPVSDQLVLLPLKEGETPLTVIADPIRRNELHTRGINFKTVDESVSLDREYILLSLSQAIAEKKLGIPLPKPGRIFAVTANFPSHIKHDLAMKDPAAPEILGTTRARIFLKYPPVMPPDSPRTAEATINDATVTVWAIQKATSRAWWATDMTCWSAAGAGCTATAPPTVTLTPKPTHTPQPTRTSTPIPSATPPPAPFTPTPLAQPGQATVQGWNLGIIVIAGVIGMIIVG